MSNAVEELVSILDLEQLEVNLFRGRSPQTGRQRVFGGLVVAQALVAASRTVTPDRIPHSLHAYFILPGDTAAPIVYDVERIRDGSSFTTRRCVAIQHGRAIFAMSSSYQVEEDGLEHQIPMPDVPMPEGLMSEEDMLEKFRHLMPPIVRSYLERDRPLELRPVDLTRYSPMPRKSAQAPVQHVWIRAKDRLPDDPAVHRAVLAFLSDMTLIDTALVMHGRSVLDPDMQAASLDHALWFHRPFRADEWMLYAQDSPNSGGARGLARGSLFTRDGKLIASTAQEGLLRKKRTP
jgi:acyl-CoA thioesterase-2